MIKFSLDDLQNELKIDPQQVSQVKPAMTLIPKSNNQ